VIALIFTSTHAFAQDVSYRLIRNKNCSKSQITIFTKNTELLNAFKESDEVCLSRIDNKKESCLTIEKGTRKATGVIPLAEWVVLGVVKNGKLNPKFSDDRKLKQIICCDEPYAPFFLGE
jgi:hypothetical protein